MADARTWIGRGLLLLAGGAVLVLSLMPVGTLPGRLPAPDILLLTAMAWVVRRPEQAPAPLLGALFLLRDVLTGAPPGLGAALALIATENLRGRRFEPGLAGLLSEWSRVAALIALVALAEQVVLSMLLLPVSETGSVLGRAILSALAYPATVIALRALVGLRAPRPEDQP